MKIQPLANNILIDIEKAPEKTASGIIIPGMEDKKMEVGTVVAVGYDVDILIEKGVKILFKAYSADTIELEGKEYNFIKSDDILALYGGTPA